MKRPASMLQRITELPADLESDSPCCEVKWGPKLRNWAYFLVRHMVYAYVFLAVRPKQLDKRVAPHVLFTWRQVLRSKRLALWFYCLLSVALELLVKRFFRSSYE